MYYEKYKLYIPFMIPIFDENWIEDEIPKTDWLDFRKVSPGVFQIHFNDVKLTTNDVKNLKRFFDRQTHQCWFYGIMEYDALEKYPVLRKLATRAGFMHDHNIQIGEFWQLYRE